MKQFLALRKYCEENNILYDDHTEKLFSDFCEHLQESNKVMNLTAITEDKDIEIKHFIDSISSVNLIREYMERNDIPMRAVDLGTGAGFPGIPLAIIFPEILFTLADSLDKRIKFLNEFVSAHNLENIETIHGRAEEIGQSSLRETFDICVSRAVAALPVLLEYTMPLVKTNGIIILYKSGNYESEMSMAENALHILGGQVKKIQTFHLLDTDIERSLIVVEKTEKTPEKYPRRPGKPEKSPL